MSKRQSDNNPCIWMQTGYVKRKACRQGYHCLSCRFDRAMRRTAGENRRIRAGGGVPPGNKGKIGFWQDRMRTLPQNRRPCVHHLKRRITFRFCTNDYSCGNCDFDQYFQDQYAVHAVVKPVDSIDVGGFQFPRGYYLHSGHTWARIEADKTVRIGMDHFSGRLLGTLDRIQTPLLGKTVCQGKPDTLVQQGRHTAAILSPLSGVVTDVNPRIIEEPAMVCRSPYTDGWLFRIHCHQIRPEMKSLMIGAETEAFLGDELDSLHAEIEAATGIPLAADGGQLVKEIRKAVPELDWDRMVRIFLRS